MRIRVRRTKSRATSTRGRTTIRGRAGNDVVRVWARSSVSGRRRDLHLGQVVVDASGRLGGYELRRLLRSVDVRLSAEDLPEPIRVQLRMQLRAALMRHGLVDSETGFE